jgi:4-hydroxybenzoate polyprenyltransferase
MSAGIETPVRPGRRSARGLAVAFVVLSALSLGLGLWVGLYGLLLAVPLLLGALRYWSVLSRRTPAPRRRFVPAVVHGAGMVAVFLVVPGVQRVRDAAHRIESV